MPNFDEDDIENLSQEEINMLFDDIIEMPAPLIAGVASGTTPCLPKGGVIYSG